MSDPESSGGRKVVVHLDAPSAGVITAGVLVLLTVYAVVRNATSALTQVGIGVILALALDGVVQKLRLRRGWRRGTAVLVVGLSLVVVALGVVFLLGPPAIDQARQFGSKIPETVRQLYDLPWVGPVLERNDAVTKVQAWIDGLPAAITSDTITNAAESLLSGLVSTFIVVVTTFAVLLDGEHLVGLGRKLIPPHHRDLADRTGRVVYRVFGQYFGGSLTIAVLMGLYVLTICLVLGIPLAPLVAIWAMITNLIPQVGGFLGGAFLTIVAVTVSVPVALIALVLFLIYMNLENQVLQPAIVGGAVNLTPPTTMLAALIGAAVGGVPGSLVATPLVGAVKQLYLETRFGVQARPPRVSAVRRLIVAASRILRG